MEKPYEVADLSERYPIVVFCGNGQQNIDLARAQIFQALDRAQVECVVLEGKGASPRVIPSLI